MEQVRDDVLASDRFALILFASFAAAALLLAAVGVYGVMSFSVAQRSHEIAICIALGASRNRVVADVIKEGVLLACIGLGLGLLAAIFEGHAMASMLYGVRALDISAFLAVALVLLSAALLACYLPARRAAGLEPMQALRTE
jgi:ABC-type antimicrobial peptide transport system permease subunit